MKKKDFIKEQIEGYKHTINAYNNSSVGCLVLFVIFLILFMVKFTFLVKIYLYGGGFFLLVYIWGNIKYVRFYESQIKTLWEKYFDEVDNEKFEMIQKQRTKLDKKFKVAGTSYNQENLDSLIKLLVTREDYIGDYMTFTNREIRDSLERIYKHSGCTTVDVRYVEEPENEYDPNAIKIYIHELFIGYVPQKINSEIKKYLNNTELTIKSSAQIVGGKYKEYSFTQDKVITGLQKYGVEVSIKAISKS